MRDAFDRRRRLLGRHRLGRRQRRSGCGPRDPLIPDRRWLRSASAPWTQCAVARDHLKFWIGLRERPQLERVAQRRKWIPGHGQDRARNRASATQPARDRQPPGQLNEGADRPPTAQPISPSRCPKNSRQDNHTSYADSVTALSVRSCAITTGRPAWPASSPSAQAAVSTAAPRSLAGGVPTAATAVSPAPQKASRARLKHRPGTAPAPRRPPPRRCACAPGSARSATPPRGDPCRAGSR